MNSTEYLEYHRQMCDKMHDIAVRKNSDYSGFSESAFANFESIEKLGAASTELGIYIRMMDKMSRLLSFIKQGTLLVEDEKIEDTMCDVANYAIIMAAIFKSKKK